MNPRERGFLLLRSKLGCPEREPLTQAQLRELRRRVRSSQAPREDRELEQRDLEALGYAPEAARRILALLSQETLLEEYLSRGRDRGCVPVTRVSPGYPQRLLGCLGDNAPAALWARGDLSLLEKEKIALVGSRELTVAGSFFAQKVGQYAAGQDLVLVSGNARGADRLGQEACLNRGGRVIAVVADRLDSQRPVQGVLYLSEEEYDGEFTPWRALSRNRIIHCLGEVTYVAQCSYGKGGTWDGTLRNLRNGWSRVLCHRDGSEAMKVFAAMGAGLITQKELLQR